MLKNKKTIFIYLLIVGLIILDEYSHQTHPRYIPQSKKILSLNSTILKSYKDSSDTNRSFNKYWGVPEEKIVLKSVKPKQKEKKVMIKKIKDKNILCIEKSCFSLIGIYQKNGKFSVMLYNKDLKDKLKSYKIHDILKSKVSITDISSDTVQFAEINATNRWDFKIFDVNQTKYKPKEITP